MAQLQRAARDSRNELRCGLRVAAVLARDAGERYNFLRMTHPRAHELLGQGARTQRTYVIRRLQFCCAVRAQFVHS